VEDDGYEKYLAECEDHQVQQLSYQEWLEHEHEALLAQLKCEMNGEEEDPSSCVSDFLDRVRYDKPDDLRVPPRPPVKELKPGWHFFEDSQSRIWYRNKELGVKETLDRPGPEHWVERAVEPLPVDALLVSAVARHMFRT
jgi:hypothetical protein